jgi:uncharacterized membrane protein HdeD (DUF308 family)
MGDKMQNRQWNRLSKYSLLWCGILWVLVGITTIFNPVFYFRGAYVDFAGYNIQVGVALIMIGSAFIGGYFWKKK